MKLNRVVAAAAVAALAGTAFGQTDLVTNGDFETGSFSGWTQFGDLQYTAVQTVTRHSGTYGGQFGPVILGGGGITQTIAATAGQQVLVSFWYQAQVGGVVNNSFDCTFDGVSLVNYVNDTTHTAWTEHTFLVTVANNNPVLQFTFLNVPSYDYLDDVHVYSDGFGSCCLGDGTCTVKTAAGCTAAAGTYAGNGSSCATTVCHTGACCLADGSCVLTGAGGCQSRNGIYRGDDTSCGSANCVPQTFVSVGLNWNFNGMVHGSAEQGQANHDNPNGYRSVADRGLLLDGAAGAINAGPIVDADFMPFTLVSQSGVLDIVHLGDRQYVANSARAWGTGTENGLQPTWLPVSNQEGPQVSNVLAMNATFTPQASLGVLYQISDSGGRFDMVLTFADSSTATVTLRAPDWYGDQSPPAAAGGSGLAAQRKLGVYTGTGQTDLAIANNPLNVTEAVVNVNSLQAAGLGNFAGKKLASITFQNPVSNANYVNSTPANGSGIAIIAASLGGVTTSAACYANCDGSTSNPLLTANDFQCFLNQYAAANPIANCDGSTGNPLLTANDFQCFLNKYAIGCS